MSAIISDVLVLSSHEQSNVSVALTKELYESIIDSTGQEMAEQIDGRKFELVAYAVCLRDTFRQTGGKLDGKSFPWPKLGGHGREDVTVQVSHFRELGKDYFLLSM